MSLADRGEEAPKSESNPGVIIGATPRGAIEAHARRTYPEECCGVLLGSFADGKKQVESTFEIDNARTDSARNRYLMGGDAVRRAEQQAGREGLDIVGYYHSHPDVPAVPSSTDKAEATWPIYSYLIVSVRRGEVAELRSWVLTEDRSDMLEEPVLQNS